MSLDPRYITSVSLDPELLDKVTGLPLVGGEVWFWRDLSRLTPKPVYELSGSPPNYTYTQLPNPMILGPKGNFVDNSGADVAVYYLPYDSFGNLDLYYVSVFNSLGVPQFVRQAWPNLTEETEPGAGGEGSLDNLISNSQFGVVNWDPTVNPTDQVVLTIHNGSQTFDIAPGWQLLTSATGAGTVTLNQIAIPGTSNFPGQPPFALQVTSAGNLTSLILQQALSGNPNIFSQDTNGNGGWVNTSITLAPGIGNDVTINYFPNGGLQSTTLLSANNVASGAWNTFNASVQLPMGANPNSGSTAATNIQIVLPIGDTTTLTNFQIVSSFVPFANGVAFQEVPLTVQQGELFGYYQPQLNFKPINSFLVGWDFPLNPAQPLGPGTSGTPLGPFATGPNTSNYFWDQTIIFQSTDSGVTAYQGASGELVIKANAATQLAVVQYLDQAVAREILDGNVSVNIAGFTNQIGGIAGTVSLWCTAGNVGTQMTTNTSIVATLNAAGFPVTNNPNAGTWTEIVPVLSGAGGKAFTLGISKTNSASQYNDIALDSFGLLNAGSITSATVNQFAIVVGFANLANNNLITLQSISCVPGDIATRPAPKTLAQAKIDCQQYYWTTFQSGTVPAQNIGLKTGEFMWISTGDAGGGPTGEAAYISFGTYMRTIPAIAYFSPGATGTGAYLETAATPLTTTTAYTTTNAYLFVNAYKALATGLGFTIGLHLTADARLGITA